MRQWDTHNIGRVSFLVVFYDLLPNPWNSECGSVTNVEPFKEQYRTISQYIPTVFVIRTSVHQAIITIETYNYLNAYSHVSTQCMHAHITGN